MTRARSPVAQRTPLRPKLPSVGIEVAAMHIVDSLCTLRVNSGSPPRTAIVQRSPRHPLMLYVANMLVIHNELIIRRLWGTAQAQYLRAL